MKRAAALISLLLIVPAQAQNTTRDWQWVVDHQSNFGEWVSACDHRSDDETERRCYIRNVDVYARNPQFGAAFLFVTSPEPGEIEFEISFERGTDFQGKPLAIVNSGVTTWSYDPRECHRGTRCTFTGADAEELATQLSAGGELQFDFTDNHDRSWERRWDATEFADAYTDFQTELAARNL